MQRPERGGIWLIIALLTGAGLAMLYLIRMPEALLLVSGSTSALLGAVAVILAAYATGRGALSAAAWILARNGRRFDPVESFAVGVPAFGTVVAVVSCLSVRPLGPLSCILALLGVWLLWMDREFLALPEVAPLSLLALAPAIVLAAAQAFAPVVSTDELVYKLGVPHAYQLYGRMVELPLNSNSYLALSFNLADLPALILGGAIAAKLVHFALYLATLVIAWRLGRRFEAPAWIVAIIAYAPVLMVTAGWAYSEWGVLGLLLLSFHAYQRWLDEDDRSDFVLAFAAAGCAISAKYTALPWIAPFALLVLWRHRRDARVLLGAVSLVALFGGFFYARNLVWTGSPFAPLLLPDAPTIQNYRSGYRFSGWVDLVLGKDVADREIGDEALGILLPLCVLASIGVIRKRDRATRDLLLIGGIQMVVLLTIAPGTRNMLNGFVACAIPGAAAIAVAWRGSGRALRAVAIGAAGACVAIQSGATVAAFADVIPYLSGAESEGAYFARTRAFHGVYRWIGESTPPDARFLLIAETRTLYMPRQFVSGGNLDGPRVSGWLASFPTAEALANGLRGEGITHVVFHLPWYRVQSGTTEPFGILRSEAGLAVSPGTDAKLKELFGRHAALRYRDAEYLVFELTRP
jgi:hypothetical protein